MKWTICWNTELSLNNTLRISGITYPSKVKTFLMSGNQQVTKIKNLLVETPETPRPLSSKNLKDKS
jgi:hypothetical protein